MDTKRQVITIHIGQAGVQMGNAVWNQFGVEHGIGRDGSARVAAPGGVPDPYPPENKTFYKETLSGKYIPRTVMVDLEPTVVDQVRTGPNRDLYHPDQLISGQEDAANNYARGYYTEGRQYVDRVLDGVRLFAESSNGVQGFVVFHSMGGGTGSGLTGAVTESLRAEHAKKSHLEVLVHPAPRVSTAVVEPYNAVLVTHKTLDTTDCAFMVDNEAIYDISARRLEVDRPSYANLNRIISQVVSSITASLRFAGPLNVDLSEFQTNLVPFPRVHFPLLAYAPLASAQRTAHTRPSVMDVTEACFDPGHHMFRLDDVALDRGRYIACCLLYRGDVVAKDVNDAIQHIRREKGLRFVDWCPTGFKVGINGRPPVAAVSCADELMGGGRDVCMMANTTAISCAWTRLCGKFDLMFRKRAFVHWYESEGMEKAEFVEARENVEVLRHDYLELAPPSAEPAVPRPHNNPANTVVTAAAVDVKPMGGEDGPLPFGPEAKPKFQGDYEF